jgi:hypothetical protein
MRSVKRLRSDTSERSINRIGQHTEAMKPGPSECPPSPRPVSSLRPLTKSSRTDNHVRATTSNAAGAYDTINSHTTTFGILGQGPCRANRCDRKLAAYSARIVPVRCG